ncbi:hypothetical protein F4803DRAFT_572745 [Xylaria telfairii]|nr:hypothetical protein F4803DRAFT_572745 [Xylaria telfairii]
MTPDAHDGLSPPAGGPLPPIWSGWGLVAATASRCTLPRPCWAPIVTTPSHRGMAGIFHRGSAPSTFHPFSIFVAAGHILATRLAVSAVALGIPRTRNNPSPAATRALPAHNGALPLLVPETTRDNKPLEIRVAGDLLFVCCFDPVSPKTSSHTPPAPPPRALVPGGIQVRVPRQASPPSSPLSSASTIDDDGELSSPILPPLPAPRLPERALGYLRTPPHSNRGTEATQYVTTSWGSPYAEADSHHLRRLSFSSETSDESPLHQLEIDTPFLRPVRSVPNNQPTLLPPNPSLSGSAAVLANRARRPLGGITEEWIRQHTTEDPSSEQRHWLSDGTDDSGHSSLSGSVASDEAGWFDEADPRTPRPTVHPTRVSRSAFRHPRKRSSNETLRQVGLNYRALDTLGSMDSLGVENGTAQDALSIHTVESNSDVMPRPATPMKYEQVGMNVLSHSTGTGSVLPATPPKPTKLVVSQTPRLKKKVPWRGKNILVLLPRDEDRGQPGKAPTPLDTASTESMLRSWEQLGYNIRGFDLDFYNEEGPLANDSRSRDEWPLPEDIVKERSLRRYHVTLPDLNAWRQYVNELAEAKLRALGVTFAEEAPPPQPSVSPVASNMSRQASNQFPPFPFSPPLPTSSAASNGPQGFPFSAPFLPGGPSASQSPAIPAVASPVSFNHPVPGRFNSRASISISPHELPFHLSGQPSPLGWSAQMLLQQQQLGRSGSPFGAMSPVSPFSPDGISHPMNVHQRHQSLQYPMLPHQFLHRQDSARASPRLQEVREDEEEEETKTNPYDKSPSKTPEPTQFIQHNASNSLQKEIDEAEYHLEEQFRSQLEHEDYSPHNEAGPLGTNMPMDDFAATEPLHARGPSVHFSGIGTDSDEGPKLHHPQPHSRGHSLSQQPFFDNDELRDSTDEGSIRKPRAATTDTMKADDAYEIETNPSNLGTPAQMLDFANQLDQRSISMASNPWAEPELFPPSKLHSRQGSHNSKPSLSKLNANAAEFKFNPKNNFTPGQFVFGGKNPQAPSFTPTSFQAPASVPAVPQSATSSHFSVPSTGSSTMAKINPTAPVFSPHKSDFSFSTSGPKFNPDAKAFQPMGSFAPSLTSTGASGNESTDTRSMSIFANIDLNGSEYGKSSKKSKAIPIMRPASRDSPEPVSNTVTADKVPGGEERVDGGASRAKKLQFRNGDNEDGDDVPRFAEPTPEPEIPEVPVSSDYELDTTAESRTLDATVDVKDDEDEATNVADVTLASTVVSESTDGKLPSESNDTKATTSPSATSPDPDKANWRPIEFTNETDMHDFNNARPFGDQEPTFNEPQKPHFSATATPFVPGSFMFGTPEMINTPFEPDFTTQPEQLVEPSFESEEDRAGSPTPGPDMPSTTGVPKMQELQQDRELSPEPAPVSARGLLSSRFASPPPPQKGLKASRYASSHSASPQSMEAAVTPSGFSPSPVSESLLASPIVPLEETPEVHGYEPLPVSPPSDAGPQPRNDGTYELTFEEIDAVMQQINENDPTMGVKRTVESPNWHQPNAVQKLPITIVTDSPAVHLPPQVPVRDDAPSPSPRQYRSLSQENLQPKPSTELDDPFIDPPHSALSQSFDAPVQRLNTGEDLPESEWDDAFSASEQGKLEHRVHYFDGHVNDLVGNLLAARLDPLENTLSTIQQVLGKLTQRAPSSRRDRRSFSAELQESDADDEDEELPMRRSISPKRDRRLEQIRIAVMDAMNQHQTARALESAQFAPIEDHETKDELNVMQALEEMKLHITESLPSFRSEDLKSIVEEAVKNHIPPTPSLVIEDDGEADKTLREMQSKITDLEERLHAEESKYNAERLRAEEMEEKLRVGEARVETETATRRSAEDRTTELRRQLEQAETKVEVEIMNRSIFDQRIHDLEDRLKAQEGKTELELSTRREAEDRLSEIQRLLRISSEEEDRLRAVVEDRDEKIKSIEQASGQTSMRLALLDAAQANAEQTQVELKNRMNVMDTELRDSRQEARHWRSEAEQARDSATRQADDFVESVNENKHLHKLIDTLSIQLEENERIRDNWRAKFVSLQDDMAHAAREITEENSRRSKKEQALIARQEVLDARLQAEARTRERLEVEVERLESGERAAMRAVSECKRLEGLLADLRNDNHDLHQQVLRSQREAQEARDNATIEKQSAQLEIEEARKYAASEVERAQLETQETKDSVEAEIQRAQLQIQEAKDAAAAEVYRAQQEVVEARNFASVETQQDRESIAVELEAARDQINMVKTDYEEELAKLRAELDQVKLDADTANEHHEMMLEEAQHTKETELQALKSAKVIDFEELSSKHQNELEDLQARYERQISNAAEDAQRTEQNLLERLSLSASKTEHLQDRVAHLEEKVQIAQEAARAAAQAAAQASKAVPMPEPSAHPGPAGQTKQLAQAMQLPEKISPQALRESIMVLQEQLQAREQRIEELEQKVDDLDPDAATKISKRDDEITWLRELLAVRHGDLQDIIAALSADRYDREAVKDATIRLKANLQMEEQERERAMNGGSALNLPNIAATISKAATPRVAQAVGPLAAAWGSWRRSNQSSLNLSGAMSSPVVGRTATPSKSNSARSQNGLLSGLMTPPTSGIRSSPLAEPSQPQPTAFGNTGRRYTAEQFANRVREPSMTARQAEKMPLASTPPPRQERKDPRTPPMMQPNSYDDDARMEEFDDASFFDD